MPGKLMVLEGTDGSGKSTQFRRLCRRMEREGYAFRRVKFPRYDEPSSALIRLYLDGAFGGAPGDVNAYAASAFYAVDRYASFRQDWGAWYQAGGAVLCDRYTTSNAIHQASKLAGAAREDFLRWLYDFEFEKLRLPRPDLVLYLDMPAEQSRALLRQRETQTNTRADIHERDADYLAACRETGSFAAELLGWRRVSCVNNGLLRTEEEIHEEIWKTVCLYL